MVRCHHGSSDPLLLPVSVAHRSREVFKATSCIAPELL